MSVLWKSSSFITFHVAMTCNTLLRIYGEETLYLYPNPNDFFFAASSFLHPKKIVREDNWYLDDFFEEFICGR
jgi:hypothetical protein